MTVEHLAAHIERVGEHADAPAAVSINGRWVPGAAAGCRYAVGVEVLGDRDRRGAGRELREDAPHDGGLRGDNLAFAAHQIAVRTELLDHRVAISDAAGGEPGTRSAELAAQGFCRQVFQEQRVHGALEADMQFADPALRQSHDGDLPRGEPLVEAGDILLIARQPIEALGEHEIDLAGLRTINEGAQAGALHCGARERVIGEGLDDRPAFRVRAVPAQRDLIFDRTCGLEFARIAGVDGDSHGGLLSNYIA